MRTLTHIINDNARKGPRVSSPFSFYFVTIQKQQRFMAVAVIGTTAIISKTVTTAIISKTVILASSSLKAQVTISMPTCESIPYECSAQAISISDGDVCSILAIRYTSAVVTWLTASAFDCEPLNTSICHYGEFGVVQVRVFDGPSGERGRGPHRWRDRSGICKCACPMK